MRWCSNANPCYWMFEYITGQSDSTYLLIHGRYLRQPLGCYDFLMTPDMSSGHWLPLHTPNLVLYDCPTRYEIQNYKIQNWNILFTPNLMVTFFHPVFSVWSSNFKYIETWSNITIYLCRSIEIVCTGYKYNRIQCTFHSMCVYMVAEVRCRWVQIQDVMFADCSPPFDHSAPLL